MRFIVRFTAFIIVAASLAYAPGSSRAGAVATPTATPTAKNCFFVRNHLPCPCPRAQKARAVARAARVTAGALGTAIGTTAVALTRADNHEASSDPHNTSQPAQPPKR